MGLDGFFLNSNNGKKIKLEDLQNLKLEDVAQNPELQKVFNIFDINKNGNLDVEEKNSLFEYLSHVSGEDEVLSDNEIILLLNNDEKLKNITIGSFKTFITSLFSIEQITPIESLTMESKNLLYGESYSTGMFLFAEDEIAQEYFLNDFYEYYEQAYSIYQEINLGVIGRTLDDSADSREENLSRERLRETLELTYANYAFMSRAKDGTLTKYEYYKESREHLKEILMNHVKLNRDIISTILERYYTSLKDDKTNGAYSRSLGTGWRLAVSVPKVDVNSPEFEAVIDKYFDTLINELSIEQIKVSALNFLRMDNAEEEQFFEEHIMQILTGTKVSTDSSLACVASPSCPPIEERLTDAEKQELITFEEVYEYEQGVPYDRELLSAYAAAKIEMEFAVNSHNRVEIFREAVNQLTEISDYESKKEKFLNFINNYYAISPESAVEDLQGIITELNLDAEVVLDENGKVSLDLKNFNLDNMFNKFVSKNLMFYNYNSPIENESVVQDLLKNNNLDLVMQKMLALQDERLSCMLKQDNPNADLNSYIKNYQTYMDLVVTNGGALNENLIKFAEETCNTCYERVAEIQDAAGVVTWIGVGITVAGGLLCLTGVGSGIGAPLITAGSCMATGGMVTENAINLTEAYTREETSKEEISNAWKMAGMSAAGMVIGGWAGKVGTKAFTKVLGNELCTTLTTQASINGGRALLREVCKPSNFAQFAKATGAKMGTDFLISYMGDLALMGVLDTQDDWKTLLQANLVGTVISTASDAGQFGKTISSPRIDTGSVDAESRAIDSDLSLDYRGEEDVANLAKIADESQRVASRSNNHLENRASVLMATRAQTINELSENLVKTMDSIDSTKIANGDKVTWENCKTEITSIIKQIKDGFIKFDNKIDEVILSLVQISKNVSGKIKVEINNLINEFKEYIRLTRDKFDKISIEQQLVNIKNIDGTQRYSDSEIIYILENIPENLNFTKKELVDLMNLEAMTVNDAIDLMAKIDSDDKFKILNALTSQRNTNNGVQTYNYFEIENFFDNLDDCEITDMYKFFVGAIDDYKYFGKNVISKESYLNELSYHLKTDKQVQIYRNMISRIKKKDCTMLPGEVFKYLDLKNEILELKMYDVSPRIMQLHSEIKNIHPLTEEQELLLAFIDDEYILSYLKDELASIYYWESIALLRSITEADGTLFSGESAFYSDGTKLNDFYNYAKKNNINIDDIETNFRHSAIDPFQASALPIDLELAARFNHLREYIGKGSNEDIKNYLYNNLYLKTLNDFGISADIISKLEEFNKQYNVKIMISSNLKEIDDILKYIELELQDWKSASNGVAKMPPVIDFNSADRNWYDSNSTQVGTTSGAYSSPYYNGSLAFNRQSLASLHWSIRHEMTHSNDLKLGKNINQSYLETNQNGTLVFDKYGAVKPKRTKALEWELLKAGIEPSHIGYAFVNTKEFIAVASEGDMSKYSPEFKRMLIEFGMPEWMFKMKCKKEIKTMLK